MRVKESRKSYGTLLEEETTVITTDLADLAPPSPQEVMSAYIGFVMISF